MKQVIKKGTNQNVFILLHGTGGNATDLFPLVSKIDPEATLVGVEGKVLENNLKRYFKRYPDGRFDLESLEQESKTLYKTIQNIISTYKSKTITVLAYSNGANIFLNILKMFENIAVSQAILLHPSPVRKNVAFKPQHLKLLLTSGQQDPYITEKEFNELVTDLKDQGIETSVYTHQWGHQITEDEYQAIVRYSRGEYLENNV